MTGLGRIALIDALRGVAALMVLEHHVMVFFGAALATLVPAPLWTALDALSACNGEAVMLFFVLSGFSIRVSIEREGLTTREAIDHYVYRRLRRILPLYLVSLAWAGAAALWVPPSDDSLRASVLLGNLAFLQSPPVPGQWFAPFAQNGPLWSLSFEMFYYLLYPALWAVARTPRVRCMAVFGASCAGFALNQVWPNPLAQFVALWLVWYGGVELAELRLRGRSAVPMWGYTLVFVALAAARELRPSETLRTWQVGIGLLLVGALLHAWSRRFASPPAAAWRGLAWVGDFSYGLYLLHYPVLRVIAAQVAEPGLWTVALAVVASLALSYGAERVLSRPRYAFLRRRYLSRA